MVVFHKPLECLRDIEIVFLIRCGNDNSRYLLGRVVLDDLEEDFH